MAETESKLPTMEQAEKWFRQQQSKGKNPAATLNNSSFKTQFGVGKASVFKCPACPALTDYPGTLYPILDKPVGNFVCRKCEEHFYIELPSKEGGILKLEEEIRSIKKMREKEYDALKGSKTEEQKDSENEFYAERRE